MKTEERSIYDKNLDLIRRFRDGDADAGEELASLNKPLIYNIAGRFIGRGADMDELVEMGTIGLVKAINTFDFSRECAFSTYAVPLIFGEMRRFLRDDGIIKVSRENKKLAAQINAERERRLASGEDAGIASIASSLGVSPQDAAAALFSTSPVRSLEEAAYDDEESMTLGATIADEDAPTKEFDKLALKLAIEKLCDTERKIIILRYFRDFSQAETARVLGLTQVKISREEKKILSRLRNELG